MDLFILARLTNFGSYIMCYMSDTMAVTLAGGIKTDQPANSMPKINMILLKGQKQTLTTTLQATHGFKSL